MGYNQPGVGGRGGGPMSGNSMTMGRGGGNSNRGGGTGGGRGSRGQPGGNRGGMEAGDEMEADMLAAAVAAEGAL